MNKKNLIIIAALVCGLSQNIFAWNNQQTKDYKANDSSSHPNVVELNATHVMDFDFSEKAFQEYKANPDYEEEYFYCAVDPGCSFYCGCNIGEQKASSTLKRQGKQDYKASNIHDLDYSTTWVEGTEGYGIGEWVEYTLPASNPRITDINIANGYVRTKKLWTENSRVKVLDVEVNGKPFARIHLADVYALQSVKVPHIGYSDRDNFEGKEPIRIRFIIREVYPGTKYQDTAISEILFDGIDVH